DVGAACRTRTAPTETLAWQSRPPPDHAPLPAPAAYVNPGPVRRRARPMRLALVRPVPLVLACTPAPRGAAPGRRPRSRPCLRRWCLLERPPREVPRSADRPEPVSTCAAALSTSVFDGTASRLLCALSDAEHGRG